MIKTESLAEFRLKFPAALESEEQPLPYTPWRDVEPLLHLAMNAPEGPMLEVGTHRGHTAAMLADEFPDRQIVTCDPGDSVPNDLRLAVQKGEYLPQNKIGEVCADRPNVTVIKQAFPGIDFGDRKFAVVFIDGDHHAEAVRRDTEKALEILAPGGVIVWHDVDNHHVPHVREVLESLPIADYVTHVEGTWIAYHVDLLDACEVAAQPPSICETCDADTELESPFEEAARIEAETGI